MDGDGGQEGKHDEDASDLDATDEIVATKRASWAMLYFSSISSLSLTYVVSLAMHC